MRKFAFDANVPKSRVCWSRSVVNNNYLNVSFWGPPHSGTVTDPIGKAVVGKEKSGTAIGAFELADDLRDAANIGAVFF